MTQPIFALPCSQPASAARNSMQFTAGQLVVLLLLYTLWYTAVPVLAVFLFTQEADGLKYAYGAPKKKYLNEEGPSK